MGSVFKQTNLGEMILMRDIILQHHPQMKKYSRSVKKAFLEQAAAGTQNVSMFLEQVVSHIGNLEQSNKPGEDHEDGSDTKFASINHGPNGNGTFAHTGNIGNLKRKRGALRVVTYIACREELQYFFIPYRAWKKFTCMGSTSIRLSYNSKTNTVSRIEKYRVSLQEMCKMR